MGASRKLDESSQHREWQKPLQAAPAESDNDGEVTPRPNTDGPAMPGDGMATKDDMATNEDWRELARRVQQEKDPNRMIELVQELISRFDKDHLRKGSRRPSKAK